MNVLSLSIEENGYLPNQPAAWPKRKVEYLEYNLRRVQHLQVEMEPCHKEQAENFRGALICARQGSVENCRLKSLNILVWRPHSWRKLWKETAKRGIDEEIAPYKACLQPFKGLTGKLTLLDREVTLDG